MIAWRMESSQGFHAIMNLFLIPLWLLSGALFPATGAAGWISAIMRLNPLTYGVAALRQLLYINATLPTQELAGLIPSMIVATTFAAGAYALSAFSMKR